MFELVAYFGALLAFGLLFTAQPSALIRPSAVVALCSVLVFCTPIALFPDSLTAYFDNRDTLFLLLCLSPWVTFGWIIATPRLSQTAEDLSQRCRDLFDTDERWITESRSLLVASVAGGLCLLVYLGSVNISNLGLINVILNPDSAALSREESFKLLEFTPAKYAYAIYYSVFAPMIAAILTIRQFEYRFLPTPIYLGLILFLAISVSLTGARSMLFVLLLTIFVAAFLRKGERKHAVLAVIGGLVALTAFSAMSALRAKGIERVELADVIAFAETEAFDRVFIAPLECGIHYNRYAEDFGLVGITGIRPLAILVGEEYQALPLLVSRAYRLSSSDTSFANAGAIFDLHAGFGLHTGTVIYLVLIGSLDFLLKFFLPLRGPLLCSVLGTFLVALVALLSSAFHTVIISNGLLGCLLFAYAVSATEGSPGDGRIHSRGVRRKR